MRFCHTDMEFRYFSTKLKTIDFRSLVPNLLETFNLVKKASRVMTFVITRKMRREGPLQIMNVIWYLN